MSQVCRHGSRIGWLLVIVALGPGWAPEGLAAPEVSTVADAVSPATYAQILSVAAELRDISGATDPAPLLVSLERTQRTIEADAARAAPGTAARLLGYATVLESGRRTIGAATSAAARELAESALQTAMSPMVREARSGGI